MTAHRRGGRAWLVPVGGALSVLVLLYAATWFGVGWWARERLAAFLGDLEGAGIAASHGGLVTGGFPLAYRFHVADPAVQSRDPALPWAWSGRSVSVEVAPWALRRAAGRIEGPQTVTAGADVDASILHLLSQNLAFSLRLAQETLAGDITWDGLAIREGAPPPAGDAAGNELTLGRGRLALETAAPRPTAERKPAWRPRDAPDPVPLPAEPDATVSVSLEAIRLPGDLSLPLGATVDMLAFRGEVAGAIGPGQWPQVLLDWRDRGGVLELKDVRLVYGPVGVAGDGTLALDGEGQPIGAFTLRVRGLDQAVAALRAAGLMGEREAMAVRFALSLLPRALGTGGDEIAVPLAIQERTVRMGPVPLFRLPEIRWPASRVPAGSRISL